jgi:hypothetical protein
MNVVNSLYEVVPYKKSCTHTRKGDTTSVVNDQLPNMLGNITIYNELKEIKSFIYLGLI